MRTLRVVAREEGRLIDALTTTRGLTNEPFFVVQQHKKHMGPDGVVNLLWKVSYQLTERGDGVHLRLSKADFPTNNTGLIQQFFARKVRPTIEKLAQSIGVSVQINLNYRHQGNNDGVVVPK